MLEPGGQGDAAVVGPNIGLIVTPQPAVIAQDATPPVARTAHAASLPTLTAKASSTVCAHTAPLALTGALAASTIAVIFAIETDEAEALAARHSVRHHIRLARDPVAVRTEQYQLGAFVVGGHNEPAVRHPGRFEPGQVRTLQRQIRRWRAMHGPRQEVMSRRITSRVSSARSTSPTARSSA